MPEFSKYLKFFFTAVLIYLSGIAEAISTQDQLNQPVFQKLTNDDGLSQGTINCIAQDQKGFIWIGTNDGLNRYDGYEFLIFRHDIHDSTSLRSNNINQILVDEAGILWIGTEKGLNRFDPAIGKFERISNTHLNQNEAITALTLDKNNNLWIGTRYSGLIRLNIGNLSHDSFVAEPDNQNSLTSNFIISLYIDSKNNLWGGLSDGNIFYFTESRKSFGLIEYDFLDEHEKMLNLATDFTEDDSGNIWITTYGNSLLFLDTKTLSLTQHNKSRKNTPEIPAVLTCVEFFNDSLLFMGTDLNGLLVFNINSKHLSYFSEGNEQNHILYRTVKTLFTDSNGNLWIGTNGKGINILSPYMINFSTITQSSPKDIALQFSSVRSILQENDSILWVGGYTGLQKINLTKNKTEEFYSLLPYSLCIDQQNPDILWIGTEGSGIFLLNKKTKRISAYPRWHDLKSTSDNRMMSGGNNIYIIVNLDSSHMLIGTNFGLHVLDKENKSFRFFNNVFKNEKYIPVENVNTIYTDKKNNIWIATMSGVFASFNPETNKLENFNLSENKLGNINISRINCIFEQNDGKFWMGTSSGLLQLDQNMKVHKVYSESEGLSNNMVYGILEDGYGNLWMSTNMGLCRFNPETEKFSSFDKNDGLPCNEFNSSAYFRSSTSKLWFGGVDGLVLFNPDNIQLAPVPDEAVICEVKLFDEPNKRDFTISYKNKITLEPGQNILRLTFSTLQYFGIKKNRYAFRFDENSEQWINLGTERNLTLTTSDPGDHTLEVTADNGNGEWTKNPAKITITLLPEFYQTNWFKALVIVLIASLITAIYLYRLNLIKLQRIKLERLVEQRTMELKVTNEELESANEAKNKFFSIIAHDLKSPFNSMIGFSNILVDDWKSLSEDEKFEIISLVKNTTEDTYQLLVNLLEWSRVQQKRVEYNPHQINLLNLAKECAKQLNADSFLKNIHITIQIHQDLLIYADPNMLHTVIRNLISNAIKFTPKNGRVLIKAADLEYDVECCVIDSGVGMSEQEAENLFKLQYRNSSKGTQGETGTGLGLVLCHEFIKKHNGKFSVKSEPGKGSSFCFTLPKQITGS
ncbi:MAG: hypothetical protein K9H16_11425 [Bacteroidales bacterium]|nr:hypothetical protein [Bacteroidales bacterium]